MRLLDWAYASNDSVTNQSVLPHAVVVLNKTPASVNEADFDVRVCTDTISAANDQILELNPDISHHVKMWRQNGRDIKNTKDLLHCYYSSFKVIRIPEKGRDMLINKQVEVLHHEIEICCRQSHASKVRARRDLNVDEFGECLQTGLDHFSSNLDQPFDFLEFSWNLNPIPPGFGGNILRLALIIKDRKDMSGDKIFNHLSHMVASCIMLDCIRYRIKGTLSSKTLFLLLRLFRHIDRTTRTLYAEPRSCS